MFFNIIMLPDLWEIVEQYVPVEFEIYRLWKEHEFDHVFQKIVNDCFPVVEQLGNKRVLKNDDFPKGYCYYGVHHRCNDIDGVNYVLNNKLDSEKWGTVEAGEMLSGFKSNDRWIPLNYPGMGNLYLKLKYIKTKRSVSCTQIRCEDQSFIVYYVSIDI